MTPTRCESIIAVYLVAACSFLSVPAFSQIHQTQPVLVVNGSGQPIPTVAQGTTNVAGTVNLSSGSTVNVGNTPNVNVANMPSVNISNTPTINLAAGSGVNVNNALDSQNNPTPLVTLDASQPYEDQCQVNFSGSLQGSCSFRAIPAGKRLVIQEFDALGDIETGLKTIAICVQGNGSIPHYFTATLMGTLLPHDFFATHQETRLYVGSNEVLTCAVAVSNFSNGVYDCQFSGFLVDAP